VYDMAAGGGRLSASVGVVRDKRARRMSKPRTHFVGRGKGTPKEREVNRRREVCEWEG
jgi:hypothetical protein